MLQTFRIRAGVDDLWQTVQSGPFKPGFHTIATIVWIAVDDSSDPSDISERCANDPNDSKDQDRWDRTLLYSSDCSDPVNPCNELLRQISC